MLIGFLSVSSLFSSLNFNCCILGCGFFQHSVVLCLFHVCGGNMLFPNFSEVRSQIFKGIANCQGNNKSGHGILSRAANDPIYWLQVNFPQGKLCFSSQTSPASQWSHLWQKMMETVAEPLPYSNILSLCLQCAVIGYSDKRANSL